MEIGDLLFSFDTNVAESSDDVFTYTEEQVRDRQRYFANLGRLRGFTAFFPIAAFLGAMVYALSRESTKGK